MEHRYSKSHRDFFKLAVSASIALLFSICILTLSSSIMWTVVMFSILLGILSIWFPIIIPISFILATVIIPDEILPVLSGTNEIYGFGIVKLHPAGISVFIGSLINIIIKKDMLISKIKESKMLFATIALFIFFSISIFAQTLPLGGLKGMPQCLENYIFPFCFFLYLLTLDKQKMLLILKYFVCLTVLIAASGLFEYYYRLNLLFDRLYSQAGTLWYSGIFTGTYRITTSMGHPLKNASYFLFSIPVSLFIFKKPYNIISAAVLVLAIFATGSRAALFLSGLIIIACYLDLRFNPFKHYKSVLITITIALAFYLILFHSTLGETVMRRFYAAESSSLIRVYSVENAPALIESNFFLGDGMSLSFESSKILLGMNRVGYENPWLMLIADVGFITTLIYLSIVLLTIVANIRCLRYKDVNRGIYLALIVSLLMVSSFNSFGSRNTINFLLWFNIALLYIVAPKRTIKA
jgi:hypothetical protein